MQVLLFITNFYMATEPPSNLFTNDEIFSKFKQICYDTMDAKIKILKQCFCKIMSKFEDLDRRKKHNLKREYFKLIHDEVRQSKVIFERETRPFFISLDCNLQDFSQLSLETPKKRANLFVSTTFDNDVLEDLFCLAYSLYVSWNIEERTVEKINEFISDFLGKEKIIQDDFDSKMSDFMLCE